MYHQRNSNFQKLDYLTEDPLSQELGRYQLQAVSFGFFKPRKATAIKNTILPCHRIIYVTQGPITYTINDRTVTLHPGDVLYTPANTVYSAMGAEPGITPEFLYLYFSVLPHHFNQDFVRLIESEGALRVFHAGHSPVEFYFHTIMEEYEGRRPGYYKKIHSYLEMIVMELLRSHNCRKPDGPRTFAPHTDAILNKATSYVAGSLNRAVRVGEVARICGVSETCLYKIFKSSLSLSPQAYILNCKMEHAAQLLKSSDMTVTQIARELAFSSSNHFSNTFYRIMQVRPSAYRKGRD